MIHIDKIDGYQIFSHNPQAKDISDAIYEILANKNTNIKVKLNPVEQDNIEETSFEKQCAKYFEENFETLATEAPLVLPTKEPEKSKDIVETMEHWCRKTNKLSSMKGLVLHSLPCGNTHQMHVRPLRRSFTKYLNYDKSNNGMEN